MSTSAPVSPSVTRVASSSSEAISPPKTEKYTALRKAAAFAKWTGMALIIAGIAAVVIFCCWPAIVPKTILFAGLSLLSLGTALLVGGNISDYHYKKQEQLLKNERLLKKAQTSEDLTPTDPTTADLTTTNPITTLPVSGRSLSAQIIFDEETARREQARRFLQMEARIRSAEESTAVPYTISAEDEELLQHFRESKLSEGLRAVQLFRRIEEIVIKQTEALIQKKEWVKAVRHFTELHNIHPIRQNPDYLALEKGQIAQERDRIADVLLANNQLQSAEFLYTSMLFQSANDKSVKTQGLEKVAQRALVLSDMNRLHQLCLAGYGSKINLLEAAMVWKGKGLSGLYMAVYCCSLIGEEAGAYRAHWEESRKIIFNRFKGKVKEDSDPRLQRILARAYELGTCTDADLTQSDYWNEKAKNQSGIPIKSKHK